MNTNNTIKRLEEEIMQLIELKAEGEYWDFKQCWHKTNVDLLFDIICFANNTVNRDSYIIIGVENNTYEIVENIKNDPNRKNQQNVIDFLKGKNFVGDVRPIVYVYSIFNNSVDVIVIKNTSNTPYYLSKNFKYIKRGIIYTRSGDTNTPNDKSADLDEVVYLWKKRFGIDLTPFQKGIALLNNPKNWFPMGTDGIHTTPVEEYRKVWFNDNYPEFTLSYEPLPFGTYSDKKEHYCRIDEIDQNFYWLAALQTNGELGTSSLHNTYYWILKLKYANSVLYTTPMITADNFRFNRIQWKNGFIRSNKNEHFSLIYSYIEKDNIDFLLDNWLVVHKETVKDTLAARQKSSLDVNDIYPGFSPYDVVLIFHNNIEHTEFIKYIHSINDDVFDDIGIYDHKESPYYGSIAQAVDPHFIEYLCKSGKYLVEVLNQWRNTFSSK